MEHDPLFEYRATDKERKQARLHIKMMISGEKYKESEVLCYACQKINKSRECPICHKGYCNQCMLRCSACNLECCKYCMKNKYVDGQGSELHYLCPNCDT